jgi:hypothetical protein
MYSNINKLKEDQLMNAPLFVKQDSSQHSQQLASESYRKLNRVCILTLYYFKTDFNISSNLCLDILCGLFLHISH